MDFRGINMKASHRKRHIASAVVGLGVSAALGLSLALPVSAAELELATDQPSISGTVAAATEAAKPQAGDNAVYIVRLADPAVATYEGGIQGLAATSPRATGARRLDVYNADSKAYQQFLRGKQDAFVASCEQALGHQLNVKFDYQHAFNGVAIELSAAEVQTVAALPEVKSVTKERFEVLETDVSNQWIGTPRIWNGPLLNGATSRGEGIVIAVFDSGINSDHPSFTDIGGDGYDHTNPLGSGNYIPGSHCDVVDPSFCNDKLIGAWDMVQSTQDPGAPQDDDGHGSHTASTAGGNTTPAATLFAPTTSLTRNISGVAPHANLIAYDVCIDSCPGSALLAAVEQVVIDAAALPNGIHALNYSISGGGDPYNDDMELGFLNATAAGIFVGTSAGNNGPGPGTTGHNSPWVSAAAAMTHNRQIVNSVVDMSSDADPLDDIAGLGFTAGYGPAPIINSADLEGAFPGSTLCGLGSIGDFNPPWPPGTFNGEIVACTRGTFGRVEKGANALSAGAGGYILMDNGGGLVGDAHVLPGVHISQADGAVLAAWLAANPSPVGTIDGWTADLSFANGDVMAGFSSRGPNSAINIIKPDIGAPGVSVFAAEADGQAPAPEYQFLSGTSMASPHNVGSAALLSAVHPDWSPYAIKSALMMTAKRVGNVKEDGVTPTDHFDVGAGRVDLRKAADAGLILDETPANFLAANPDTGGDPRTLNIASMQDDTCVGECSWSRAVTNVSGTHARYRIKTEGPDGLALSTTPSGSFGIRPGQSVSIKVNANTTVASGGWNFANLSLDPGGAGPTLNMPIAVQAVTSSNPNALTKTVDHSVAADGELLTYTIGITNGQLTNVIDLRDSLPDGLDFVPGSETEVVTNGTTISPFSHSGGVLRWAGTLAQSELEVSESPSPFGFFPLASLGIAPFGCPSNCDDGAWIVNVPAFVYNGETYTSVIWSVNGTLEAGTASGLATSFANQNLPDTSPPNNLMSPFWTDLNMGADGDGAEWYLGVLNAGDDQFTVYEWNNIPPFGDDTTRFSFQIWVQNGDSGNIWFVYGQLDNVDIGATVGVENDDGTVGQSYFFEGAGTPPAVGTDLKVETIIGGTATLTFQAEVDGCDGTIVNRANMKSRDETETAIAVTTCD